MNARVRRELVGIALKALQAIAQTTPMSKRHHDMWRLAINRVHQTATDVEADEAIAASRQARALAPKEIAERERIP